MSVIENLAFIFCVVTPYMFHVIIARLVSSSVYQGLLFTGFMKEEFKRLHIIFFNRAISVLVFTMEPGPGGDTQDPVENGEPPQPPVQEPAQEPAPAPSSNPTPKNIISRHHSARHRKPVVCTLTLH